MLGNFTRHLEWTSTQLKNVTNDYGTNIIRNMSTGDYVIFIVMLTFTNGNTANTVISSDVYEFDILASSGIFKNYTKVVYTVTTDETNNIYDRYYTFK